MGATSIYLIQKLNPGGPKKAKASDLLVLYAGTHGIANGLDSVLNRAIELNARGRKDIKILFLGQGKLKQHLIDRSSEEC